MYYPSSKNREWRAESAHARRLQSPARSAALKDGFPEQAVRVPEAKRGQTMIEYAIVAGMLLAAVAILAVFLYTFREHSGRVLDLVSSEYP